MTLCQLKDYTYVVRSRVMPYVAIIANLFNLMHAKYSSPCAKYVWKQNNSATVVASMYSPFKLNQAYLKHTLVSHCMPL